MPGVFHDQSESFGQRRSAQVERPELIADRMARANPQQTLIFCPVCGAHGSEVSPGVRRVPVSVRSIYNARILLSLTRPVAAEQVTRTAKRFRYGRIGSSGTIARGNPPRSSVVDIGSNSVRLVIYEGLNRSPWCCSTKRSYAAWARGLSAPVGMDEAGIARALAALVRFPRLSRIRRARLK